MRNRRQLYITPDRGWAWVVMIGTMGWNFLVGGTIKTFGMQYVEFMELFPNSPAEVGMIGLLVGIMGIFVAPFSGRLSDRYPVRPMMMVEGLVASAAICATAWASNLTVAVLTYGGIFGMCLGLMDGPILGHLGKCFHEHRNLASGISFAGGSVGTLVMAHVMAHSIATYTIRGALITLAGAWLHTLAIGAVLRPVSPRGRETEIPEKDVEISFTGRKDDDVVDHDGKPEANIMGNIPHSEESTDAPDVDPDIHASLEGATCMPVDGVVISGQSERTDLGENNNPGNIPNAVQDNSSSKGAGSCQSLSIGGDVCDNQSQMKELSVGKDLDYFKSDDSYAIRDSFTTSVAKAAREYVIFLNDGNLIITLLVLGCGFLAYYGTIVAMAPYMEEQGMTHTETAWFMTIFGATEIFCRISMAWTIDHFHIPPSLVLKISYILLGIASQVVISVPSFEAFLCYGCVLGPLAGLCNVLMMSLMCACAGVDRLGSAMGLVVMLHNIMASLTSGIAGLMFQLTGSYGNAVRFHGGVYLLGSVVYITWDCYYLARRKQ